MLEMPLPPNAASPVAWHRRDGREPAPTARCEIRAPGRDSPCRSSMLDLRPANEKNGRRWGATAEVAFQEMRDWRENSDVEQD